ncbi:uncharacterized protein BJX67DRAFT_157309 [Aspergillus lucknowensis]|uniref:Uncharacterized protein n=1 Tax=Aspergillus lucknowensis TaxID=176173 RepID=A0ABR4LN54_9EURO
MLTKGGRKVGGKKRDGGRGEVKLVQTQKELLSTKAADLNRSELPQPPNQLVQFRLLSSVPPTNFSMFYNLVLFISSVAVFSLAAQRMSGPKLGK